MAGVGQTPAHSERVDDGDRRDSGHFDIAETLRDFFGPMIRIDANDVIHFVHQPVKDFFIGIERYSGDTTLVSGFALASITCHANIAITCLTYLRYDEHDHVDRHNVSSMSKDELYGKRKEAPLFDYPTRHWARHVQEASSEEGMHVEKMWLAFTTLAQSQATFWKLCYLNDHGYPLPEYNCLEPPAAKSERMLLAAAHNGLVHFARKVLENSKLKDAAVLEVLSASWSNRCLLSQAMSRRDVALCKLLLSHGAHCDIKILKSLRTIFIADEEISYQLCSLIIEYCVDFNIDTENARGTPNQVEEAEFFSDAVQCGYRGTVRAFLEAGALQIYPEKYDQYRIGQVIPVLEASIAMAPYKHQLILENLLEFGIGISGRLDNYGKELYLAASNNKLVKFHLLLSRGAKIKPKGEAYDLRSLLRAAAHSTVDIFNYGYADGLQRDQAHTDSSDIVVELLEHHGAKAIINHECEHEGTALHGAIEAGNKIVVEVLLNNGADVDIPHPNYGTPLQAVSATRLEHTPLLDTGEVRRFQLPAFKFDYLGIADLLIKRGAAINAMRGTYGTALHAAAAAGHEDVVMLLLDSGAAVNTRGGIFNTALQVAAASGSRSFYTDNFCWSQKNPRIIQMLLAHGADVNAKGGMYGSALQAAAALKNMGAFKLLLESGADIRPMGDIFNCPLQGAALEFPPLVYPRF